MSVRDVDTAALANLPRSDLVGLWKAHYGTAPPKGISRRLMVLAVIYGQQVAEQGALRPALVQRLAKLSAVRPNSPPSIPSPGKPNHPGKPTRALSPGARLVREWNGVTHVVDVVEDGYVWKGDRYRSLSAVARAITGARWSGPRFFGTGS